MPAPLPGQETLLMTDEQATARTNPAEVAPGAMSLLYDEVVNGFQTRNITERFNRFQRYAGYKLDSSRSDRTGSELTGMLRLNWYQQLYRNLLASPQEAEAFTRELHDNLTSNHKGLAAALLTAREKMDVAARTAEPRFRKAKTSDEALIRVQQALVDANLGFERSVATLSESELQSLQKNLYRVFAGEAKNGHTLPNRSSGRMLCGLLRKMDRSGLYDAADALSPLSNPALLDQLASISDVPMEGAAHASVTGTVLQRITTPAGDILVGGRESNTYKLDEMANVACVIDLGGNDVYLDGSTAPNRPVIVLLDMAGSDKYHSTRPGVQGGAVLGVSMLIDRDGDDSYQANDVAQGSAIGGIGILIDEAGSDTYRGIRRVQGQALGGVGILIDRDGDDAYRAALWAQGLGNPLGFGVLEDSDGNDHYFVGGYYLDSYEETPGYDGWGQGVGAGLRQVANGGFGTILDGGGDDVYEFDYMAHGGGYWLGVGFARDFGGNDQRLGATRTMYDGRQRRERSFQRFSNGFGCHYALGFLFDDAGDDRYHGTIMGVGMAWDLSIGVLCDFAGNDRYTATGGLTQGNGAEAGIGILFDYDGDDQYSGYGQGRASSGVSYHEYRDCGGNFSFVVDYGGEDGYGCRAKNNTYNQRSSNSGFLIDRPRRVADAENAEVK